MFHLVPPELITLFTIVAGSLLIVRAGGIALVYTGLSWQSAIFQSQSAFMEVGFSITRHAGVVLGTPGPKLRLEEGDKVLCYGLSEDLARLSQRRCGEEDDEEGDKDHELSKRRQRLPLVEERVEDELGETEQSTSA